ncbi:MAG: glycosyltransferase family 4 protein, partial [Acidimicrobiia bacterium]|nr:glycosyltransferase family 4 protein [Acidimicrobiia bacterium]
ELRLLATSSALASVRCIYPSSRPSLEPGHIAVRWWARGGRFVADIPSTHAYPLFVQAACLTFDVAASRAIPPDAEGFTGFASHSLRAFRRARRLGIPHLGLAAPNSHVDNLWRQQALARALYPVDRGWLTGALRRRTLKEYDAADAIFISSEYQRSTFLEGGVDPGKLVRLDLRPPPRFERRRHPPSGDTFNVVYVGRVDLIKGIPVLLDAFAAVAGPDWRLTMMGAFSSWALRRYVRQWQRRDRRITVLGYGDPLEVLRRAHVFVHPSFEDGFGYAPMEALAVGVPVIVTDQTGMAEHVEEGVTGSVIAAGDVDALAERLRVWSGRLRDQ